MRKSGAREVLAFVVERSSDTSFTRFKLEERPNIIEAFSDNSSATSPMVLKIGKIETLVRGTFRTANMGKSHKTRNQSLTSPLRVARRYACAPLSNMVLERLREARPFLM